MIKGAGVVNSAGPHTHIPLSPHPTRHNQPRDRRNFAMPKTCHIYHFTPHHWHSISSQWRCGAAFSGLTRGLSVRGIVPLLSGTLLRSQRSSAMRHVTPHCARPRRAAPLHVSISPPRPPRARAECEPKYFGSRGPREIKRRQRRGGGGGGEVEAVSPH